MSKLKLTLLKEEEFLGTKCDFYVDENDNIYMTSEQIGQALEYKNPLRSISNLHNKDGNKERLDKFSVVTKLVSTDGKQYSTRLYIEKGIYDICRFSRQPVADKFYDWVYDQITLIRKTGGIIDDKDKFIETYCGGLDNGVKTIVKSFMTKVEEQQKEILEMKPKVEYHDIVLDSEGCMTTNTIASDFGFTAIKLNRILNELKIQYKQSGRWYLYAEHKDKDYARNRTATIGNNTTTHYLVWTERGRQFIHSILKENGYKLKNK